MNTKRNFLKNMMALALSCTIICSTMALGAACSQPNTDNSSVVEENLLPTDLVMKIGAFNDPFVNENAYKLMADCGINRIIVNKTRSHSQVLKILGYCEQLNMDAIILAGINNKVLYNNDYMNYKSFAGVDIYDEPSYDQYVAFSEKIPTFEATYPGKIFYSNLFPDPETNYGKLGTDTYEEYVEGFCENVLSKLSGEKILSVDIYPLETIRGEHTVQSRYLPNLEVIAKYAKQYEAEPQVYLQSICYADRRVPSQTDIDFQVYTSLAFGYRSLKWFTYYTPGPSGEFLETDFGIVDREGNPTELYDRVKSVNEEIFKFDDVYLSYSWDETIPVYGNQEPDEQLSLSRMENQNSSTGHIASVESTYDALIGKFSRGSKKAYMVTNFREPRSEGNNTVTLTMPNVKKVKVWLNGDPQEMEVVNNLLVLELPAGEGAFVQVL